MIWTPDETALIDSNIARFARMVACTRGVLVDDYDAMWDWSVDDLVEFWLAVWDFFEVGPSIHRSAVLTHEAMPGSTWFHDAQVNLAERLLRPRGRDDAEAIVTVGETGDRQSLTWTELRRASSRAGRQTPGIRGHYQRRRCGIHA